MLYESREPIITKSLTLDCASSTHTNGLILFTQLLKYEKPFFFNVIF